VNKKSLEMGKGSNNKGEGLRERKHKGKKNLNPRGKVGGNKKERRGPKGQFERKGKKLGERNTGLLRDSLGYWRSSGHGVFGERGRF